MVKQARKIICSKEQKTKSKNIAFHPIETDKNGFYFLIYLSGNNKNKFCRNPYIVNNNIPKTCKTL